MRTGRKACVSAEGTKLCDRYRSRPALYRSCRSDFRDSLVSDARKVCALRGCYPAGEGAPALGRGALIIASPVSLFLGDYGGNALFGLTWMGLDYVLTAVLTRVDLVARSRRGRTSPPRLQALPSIALRLSPPPAPLGCATPLYARAASSWRRTPLWG